MGVDRLRCKENTSKYDYHREGPDNTGYNHNKSPVGISLSSGVVSLDVPALALREQGTDIGNNCTHLIMCSRYRNLMLCVVCCVLPAIMYMLFIVDNK